MIRTQELVNLLKGLDDDGAYETCAACQFLESLDSGVHLKSIRELPGAKDRAIQDEAIQFLSKKEVPSPGT
ncbi:MAG: hypothetical protein ACFFAD_09750 [Candidatus Hermodarchaeota archaeon]